MDYFDCAYFDSAYFDTDCADGGGIRVRRRFRPIRLPEPRSDDEDALFLLEMT